MVFFFLLPTLGYLVDINGTKEKTTKVVVNDKGEEEEHPEEDFSHEIPWPGPVNAAGKGNTHE